jgi:hypothetical protein
VGDSGFPEAEGRTPPFPIPTDAGRRVSLVAEHLEEFRSEGETLVWFDDWAVWPSGQRMHVFERFLASYGERRALIDVPAFVFSRQEYEDLVSFVTLGVLFLWDVRVVSAKARRLLFYSHDEWVGGHREGATRPTVQRRLVSPDGPPARER